MFLFSRLVQDYWDNLVIWLNYCTLSVPVKQCRSTLYTLVQLGCLTEAKIGDTGDNSKPRTAVLIHVTSAASSLVIFRCKVASAVYYFSLSSHPAHCASLWWRGEKKARQGERRWEGTITQFASSFLSHRFSSFLNLASVRIMKDRELITTAKGCTNRNMLTFLPKIKMQHDQITHGHYGP